MAIITTKLRTLIQNSENLDDLEKKYWLEILPSLNDQEADRIESILVDFKKKKDLLEKQYKNSLHALEN